MKFKLVWLLVILPAGVGIFVFPNPVASQNQFPLPDFTFVKTFSSSQPVVGRSGVYDFSATAMLDQGKLKIWDCGEQTLNGQPAGNDAIVYTEVDPQTLQVTRQSQIVMNRTFTYPRLDNYMCAPSVIKHDNPQMDPDGYGPIAAGAELYLMYFECAYLWQNKCDGSLKSFNCDPAIYPDITSCQNAPDSPYRSCTEGTSQFGPAQICLASSTDGINWAMYNSTLWNRDYSHYSYNYPGTEPTVVIPASQAIRDACGMVDGEGYVYANYDKCARFADNYGSGMPSARVEVFPNGGKQIWLYYIDTGGNWGTRRVYRVTSWDGFHFDPPLSTNVMDAFDIKLYSATSVLGQPRFYYMGTAVAGNAFGYSFDGVNFKSATFDPAWYYARYTEGITDSAELDSRVKEIATPFHIGQARSDLCITPAPPGVAGDKYGNLNSLSNIIYLSGEGKYGDQILGQTPGSCYSELETQHVGSTWDIYAIVGKLVDRIRGDVNFDGIVSTSDVDVIKSNFGKNQCYIGTDQDQNCHTDIFDLNLSVSNFGVNKTAE